MSYNPNYVGNVAKGSSRQTQSYFENGVGASIPIGTPVSVNNVSNMILLDVTSETSVQGLLGLTSATCPIGALGTVVNSGRLEGVNLGFSVGDAIYAGTTPGSLTNIKPDLTVGGWSEGYFVIFFGVYVVNQFNPGLYDIQLMPTVVGQL